MKQFRLGEGRRQTIGLLTFDRLAASCLRSTNCAARSSILVSSALCTYPMHYPLLRAGRACVTLDRLLGL